MKIVLCAIVGITALSLAACSKGNEDKSPSTAATNSKLRNGDPPKLKYHTDMMTTNSAKPGTSPQNTPVLESLKKNHLEVSSTKTIGEAFDSYRFATKKEWRETAAKNGSYYIDFVCWLDVSPVSAVALKEGVVKRELDIKFVIHDGGDTSIAMATRIDTKSDGMIHTTIIEPTDIKKVVTAIYENREIPF